MADPAKTTVAEAAEILLRSREALWSAAVAIRAKTGKSVDASSIHELLMHLASKPSSEE